MLEWFSFDYRIGQSHMNADDPLDQSKLRADTCGCRKARENVCERATIGYGLTFDWITKWREFSRPIAQRDNAKPKQIRIIFTLK